MNNTCILSPQHFDWYSIREKKVSNSIFIFHAISVTSVGKPPCFLQKKEWFIWKFWKKGGGNEIHAPCTCGYIWKIHSELDVMQFCLSDGRFNFGKMRLLYIFIFGLLSFVLFIFIFHAISVTSVGKPPCFLHFLPCLHMVLTYQTVSKTLT
jgi:hypothetical protein